MNVLGLGGWPSSSRGAAAPPLYDMGVVQQQALLLPYSGCRRRTHLRKGSSSVGYPRRRISGSGMRVRATASPEEEKGEILPNALRRKVDPLWAGAFTLGVDLGMSRTGLALSKGFSPRPLSVLGLRGQKLELRLLDIAEKEADLSLSLSLSRIHVANHSPTSIHLDKIHEADEFIIGLPKSGKGEETPQSNKVRSIAGRLAVRAAQRGWRVYLQDEHGTSDEALDFMIAGNMKMSARRGRIDAYAAMMILERYFAMSGKGTELVLPKQPELQERLLRGPPKDQDFFPEEQFDG
ncbi:hypothetical protein ACLOJK_005559 [Asimina triloba]